MDTKDLLEGVTLAKLHQIFQSIIRRQESRMDPIRSHFGKIEKEEISLDERIEDVFIYVCGKKEMQFSWTSTEKERKNAGDRYIFGNSGIDENGKISVTQEKTFEDIIIEAKEETRGEDFGNQKNAGSY